MDITSCVNCGIRVIPQADHSCPSCGRSTVVAVAGNATPPDEMPQSSAADSDNPYRALPISVLTAADLDALIAKRERGIKTSIWWMTGSGFLTLVSIAITGYIYLGALLFIGFVSGLIGFVVDQRALGRLQRQRSQLAEAEAPTIPEEKSAS